MFTQVKLIFYHEPFLPNILVQIVNPCWKTVSFVFETLIATFEMYCPFKTSFVPNGRIIYQIPNVAARQKE